MVTITETKLIIELEHPQPRELLRDLKFDIMHMLELPYEDVLSEREYQNAKSTMLVLLRHLIAGGNAGK
jgi:hypothetical protein